MTDSENYTISNPDSFFKLNDFKAVFEPKPDITAYELAMLLPHVSTGILDRDTFNKMPFEIQRHLRVWCEGVR